MFEIGLTVHVDYYSSVYMVCAIFRELAKHKEVEVVEGHLMSDHVHRYLSIPPQYAVLNVVGYFKNKRV